VRFGPPDDFKSLYSASFYCWFQWWAVSISLLITSHQLSLSLSTSSTPVTTYNIQPTVTSTFSLLISTTISHLTILELFFGQQN
jgi:hypothetical protein